MIFRLSQNLSKKIKVEATDTLPIDENHYADWSARLFTVDRSQYIILSNTKSLYSMVMFGKGITNEILFIDRALTTIREFMQDDGEQFAYRKFIAPARGTVQFSKTLNRSVTSSMNQLVDFAEILLIEEKLQPHEVGFRLNNYLLSAAATEKSHGYGKPKEAFKMLKNSFGGEGN